MMPSPAHRTARAAPGAPGTVEARIVEPRIARPGRARRVVAALAALLALASVPGGAAAAPARPVRVGVILDGAWDRNDELLALYRTELTALMEGEFAVTLPPAATVVADWTTAGVEAALRRLLADRGVDVVIASGPLATHVAARGGPYRKPVFAPFAIDVELQGLPREGAASGVHNLNYLTASSDLERVVQTFLELAPFDRLAVLANQRFLEAIPGLRERAARPLRTLGIELDVVPVDSSVDAALAALPAATEAALVVPLLHLPRAEADRLVAAMNERRIRTFSLMGDDDVERGMLAGLYGKGDWQRLARRVALNVQRSLLGEDPGDLAVAFSRRERLTLNVATARAIGYSPPWAVLTEARLVNEEPAPDGPPLTLDAAVREALAANRDLAGRTREVAAGAERVIAARSRLLPQVALTGAGLVVDEDRAAASFGAQAQRSLTGAVRATQVLLSDDAWTGYTVEQRQQEIRERARDEAELDVAVGAARAYLDVLRARTLERIRKANLGVTRSNLELARVRQLVGASGPGEVYRWENQLASDRQSVIDAGAARQIAEIELNRVLHRPLEARLDPSERSLESRELLANNERLRDYAGNPRDFRIFREFMVGEALEASPELAQLDAAIAAQERTRSNAWRAFWVPDLTLQGQAGSTWEDGAGTDGGPALPGLEPGATDDLDWSVTVQGTLPLFSSGGRVAEVRAADETVSRLRLEREALAERIEQRVRTALHRTGASTAALGLSASGAEAARKSLALVTDAYSQGSASVLDLLDAQNASVVADQLAATAVHDFMSDLFEVQRAAGRIDLLLGPAERGAFFRRADAHFESAGLDRP